MSVVEQAVGRPLRQAEQAIDVARLDRALQQAKDAIDAEIQAEMLRATLRWRDLGVPPRLRVTDAMLAPLRDLHDLGREEARLELGRLGYPARSFARATEPAPQGPDDLEAYIGRQLPAIAVQIEAELVDVDLSALADAIARALLRIPGGRDIASRVVSTALVGGLARTWDQVETDVGGWEITAVLDAATCGPCNQNDGLRFRTRAQAYAFLPNGGPAVYCLGGGRCRCRLVPLPYGESVPF